MININELRVKIFADGANRAEMLELHSKPFIKGFTTNPTLMRKAGIKNYEAFAKEILKDIKEKPISFEVFSDDFKEMEQQAEKIASWGDNVYVKIPITNTKAEKSYDLIKCLIEKKIKLNITAIMTINQIRDVLEVLDPNLSSFVSIFAGRIADTGRDPVPILANAIELMKSVPLAELIWASPRELLNIIQANEIGCHVITVTNDILKKVKLIGYDLEDFSLDTVKMFYKDAIEAAFNI